jgi:hypothetical protein
MPFGMVRLTVSAVTRVLHVHANRTKTSHERASDQYLLISPSLSDWRLFLEVNIRCNRGQICFSCLRSVLGGLPRAPFDSPAEYFFNLVNKPSGSGKLASLWREGENKSVPDFPEQWLTSGPLGSVT